MGLSMILEEIRNIQPHKKTSRPPMKRATKNTKVRNGLLLEKKQTPPVKVLQLLATTRMCRQNEAEITEEHCITQGSEPLAKISNSMGVSFFNAPRDKTLKRALSDSLDDKRLDVGAFPSKCNEFLKLHEKANSTFVLSNKSLTDSIKISSSHMAEDKCPIKEASSNVNGACVSHAKLLLNKLKHLHKKKVSHNLQHYQTCLQHLLNKATTIHPRMATKHATDQLIRLLHHKILSIEHKVHEVIQPFDHIDTDVSSEDEGCDGDDINNLTKQLWLVKDARKCSNDKMKALDKRLLVCVDASKWLINKKMLAQYLQDHPPNNHSLFTFNDDGAKYDATCNIESKYKEDDIKHVSFKNEKHETSRTPISILPSKFLQPLIPHLHPPRTHLTPKSRQLNPVSEFFWKNQLQLQEVFTCQPCKHKRINKHNGSVKQDDFQMYDEEDDGMVMADDDDVYEPALHNDNKRHSTICSHTNTPTHLTAPRNKQASMHRRVRSQNFDINDVYLPCDKIFFKPTTLSSKQIDVPEWTIDPLYDNLLAINNSKSLRNSINHSINDDKVAYNYVGRIFGEGDEEMEDICDGTFMQRHLTQEIFEKKSRLPNYNRHNKLHRFNEDKKYGHKIDKKSPGKTLKNCNSSCTTTSTTVAPQPITSHDSMPYKHSSTISASSDALESSCQSHDMYDTIMEDKNCEGNLDRVTFNT